MTEKTKSRNIKIMVRLKNIHVKGERKRSRKEGKRGRG